MLRERLGARTLKDGCAPQGQCGCCTVWVDGAPRVACVTPARRVSGRSVTTLDGLDPAVRQRWADAFSAAGASQCGFCTPGIIMRLVALEDRGGGAPSPAEVESALLAHLCRCTGWRTILEAAQTAATAGGGSRRPEDTAGGGSRRPEDTAGGGSRRPEDTAGGGSRRPRDMAAAERRAGLEGRTPQRVGREVALGRGGFADDGAPAHALVAVPDGRGDWVVAETLHSARALAGKVQGRRSTLELSWPLEVPPGAWDLSLATTWVEPAYLETDASWCEPGGVPADPVANGGAFGGKLASEAPAAARRLADRHGRPVRVVLSREDVVRRGPKRPPLAVGLRADGTGEVRVVRTPGIAAAIASVAPGLRVEELAVLGPPTSVRVRGAGWMELAAVLGAQRARDVGPGAWVEAASPEGARAAARVRPDGVEVQVFCGPALDPVVLRSYCIGAAHMALGWVRSEGLAVDAAGEVHDLTIRSFGILRAGDMPPVGVEIETGPRDAAPVNGSDAVMAAVAGAAWLSDGLPGRWPHQRGGTR